MRDIDLLKKNVYNTPYFSVKGRTRNLEDVFLAQKNGIACVLFTITNVNFDGSSRNYTYLLYSLKDEREVDKTDPLYQAVLSTMPPLEEATKSGGHLDLLTLFALESELDSLIGSFTQNKCLNEQEKQQYLSYLDRMQAMQSPSFTAVYQAAKNLI